MNISLFKRWLKLTSVAVALVVLSPFLASADSIVPQKVESSPSAVTSSIQSDLEHAVNAAQYGFDKSGVHANLKQSAVSPVAIITIFADSNGGSSGYVSGHAFITVKNVSGGSISVGKLPGGIANNTTVSVGTWGNKSEHIGLWYNLESYIISHTGDWSTRKSASYIMNATELATLNNYIANHDSWGPWPIPLNNCSSFASGAWNATVAAAYDVSAGSPNTPTALASSIVYTFPSGYQIGAPVPWNYAVYYAQGTGTPLLSGVYI